MNRNFCFSPVLLTQRDYPLILLGGVLTDEIYSVSLNLASVHQ